jgi:hypothetical protein
MKSKTFTSQNGCFSLTLPIEWNESDDGEENTYTFSILNIGLAILE